MRPIFFWTMDGEGAVELLDAVPAMVTLESDLCCLCRFRCPSLLLPVRHQLQSGISSLRTVPLLLPGRHQLESGISSLRTVPLVDISWNLASLASGISEACLSCCLVEMRWTLASLASAVSEACLSCCLVDLWWSLSSHCSKDSAALLSCSCCLLCTSWCCLWSALRASWRVMSHFLCSQASCSLVGCFCCSLSSLMVSSCCHS